jgi:squalene-hopene/tetraprenyl-beta-curcumene cyclase
MARLLDLQDPCGCWPTERSSVVPDVEDLLYREFAGIRTAEVTQASARWIRSRQSPDGSWSDREHGAGDVAASVLAYLALRLAGDSPDAYHMALAAGWIRDAGGPAAAGFRARIWLATFGHAEWPDVPFPLMEAFFLPTVSPLAVLTALCPVRALPFDIGELRPIVSARRGPGPREYLLRQATQAVAARRCGAWIAARQRADGTWPGSRGGWLASLMALELLGYRDTDAVLARGRAALDAAVTWTPGTTGPVRQVTETSPPVRQTGLAVAALVAAGLPGDHPALTASGAWLAGQDVASMGGEAAASFLLARPQPAIGQPVARRIIGLQRGDGGWARHAPAPGDPGELPNGSCALSTAGAVHGLAVAWQPGSRALRRGVTWLLRAQLPDGAWPAEPGTADVRTTCAALSAVIAAGVLAGKPTVRGAVRWLVQRRNGDGGWGNGRSGWNGRQTTSGRSAPVPTALAVAALTAVGGPDLAEPIERGVAFLVRTQRPDGGWVPRQPEDGEQSRAVEHLAAPLTALGGYLFGPQPAGGPQV